MTNLWIVLQREFGERVRSKAFILSTILLPVFALGIFIIPYLMERTGGGGEHRVVVVDETPAGVGERIAALLAAQPESDRAAIFQVEHVRDPLPSVRDSLTERIQRGTLDGYLWLGEDFVADGAMLYRARNVTNMAALQRLRAAGSQVLQAERLDRIGVDHSEVAALMRPAALGTSRVTRTGEEAGDAVSTMVFAYIVAIALYFFILLYGTQVMQSVHEEKMNRIAEVLMSSVRAPHLLAGKIFGVGAAAMVQMVVWGGLVGVAFLQRERVAAALEVPVEALEMLRIEPGVAVLLLLFALLGFFLYASLFAVVGAATQDNQDGQQLLWIVLLPLFAPLILQFELTARPHGAAATALGWIPFTSPLAMPIRMGAADISMLELAGSLAVLVLSLAAVAWVAGKIYRVGMLSTGKRPSLRELWVWVRTA